MAQLTTFPLPDRIRVFAADNTSMNTQLLVDALGRDGQFHLATPASREPEIAAAVKRERSQVALISARQGHDTRAGFNLCREIRSLSPTTRVILLLDCSERAGVIERLDGPPMETVEDGRLQVFGRPPWLDSAVVFGGFGYVP